LGLVRSLRDLTGTAAELRPAARRARTHEPRASSSRTNFGVYIYDLGLVRSLRDLTGTVAELRPAARRARTHEPCASSSRTNFGV